MELGEFEVVAVERDDPRRRLDEHRFVYQRCIPSVSSDSDWLHFVGGHRTRAGETAADDHDACQIVIQIGEGRCVHGESKSDSEGKTR